MAVNLVEKNKNLYANNMIDFDYQISVVERSKDNMGFDKNNYEKVEIAFDFVNINSKKDKYEKSLIKMNYFEFQEILEQFKKLDKQLQLFKN